MQPSPLLCALGDPTLPASRRLQGETEAIGKLLEKTQLKKYGPAELSSRFMIMDTICDATQARHARVGRERDGRS